MANWWLKTEVIRSFEIESNKETQQLNEAEKRVVIQCIVNSELGQSIMMEKYWKNKSKHNVYCFDDMYNNSSTGINKVWHVTSDVLNRITYSQLVVWLWT